MKESAESKIKKEPITEKMTPMTELADKALKNYEEAIRTGLKLQAETMQNLTNSFSQAVPSANDWEKAFNRFASMASNAMPAVEERVEEVLELTEKNGRLGADLMRKSFEASQCTGIGDSQQKWVDVWATSLGAIRANTDALTQINARAFDAWLDFIRQNTDAVQMRAPKMA